ncbi:MAG TPA: PPK2 family polyphosphate kinase [Capsulimonadaceae bacterium]|jgi:PPK2 family polyphosphate:nucleotide phosphotransferase
MGGCIRWDSDKQCKLSKIDPGQHNGLTEEAARAKFAEVSAELGALQDLMYGACMNSVLLVFQAMDTGGKDGVIRNVMGAVNPQSCYVIPFKAPAPVDLAHDFLWRIHKETPSLGHFTIFNRSHYEDVLVARVHNLVPKSVWKKRYKTITSFEELLTDSNTIVLKFFLYISKDEQEARLLKREQDPNKSWKLSPNDWRERENWDDYMEAYEDAISKTSTPNAPWLIVPANHKWYRDLIVSQAIVEALRPYRKQWHKRLVETGELMKAELAKTREGAPKSKPLPHDAVSG